MVLKFSFENPQYLVALIAIPIMILIYFLSLKTRKPGSIKFANFEAISRIKGIDIYSKNIQRLFMASGIIFMLVLSASGLTINRTAPVSHSSFVISIDSSQSMLAADFEPNRLMATKEIAKDFVRNAPHETRIGVISFATYSLVEQDVTEDKSKIISAINNIRISKIGGTELKGVVTTAYTMLLQDENKALIIISDGQVNLGTLEDSISYAEEKNMIVHTIAIGTKEGGDTGLGFISRVDVDSLKSIAHRTHGNFYDAKTTEDLEISFKDIMDKRIGIISTNLSAHLLLFSILLFTIDFILRNFRVRIF